MLAGDQVITPTEHPDLRLYYTDGSAADHPVQMGTIIWLSRMISLGAALTSIALTIVERAPRWHPTAALFLFPHLERHTGRLADLEHSKCPSCATVMSIGKTIT